MCLSLDRRRNRVGQRTPARLPHALEQELQERLMTCVQCTEVGCAPGHC